MTMQSAKPAKRRAISLDGVWRLTTGDGGKIKDYPVTVPCPWQTQSEELRQHSGRATYRRRFRVPNSWAKSRVFVCFGAVDYYAEVFVNGIKAGGHEGGYTPFEFDVTDSLRFDQSNEIEVRVVDPSPGKPCEGFEFEDIPHGKQSWYGNCSGIWQSVRLEARAAVHITRVVIDPDIDRSVVRVEVFLNRAAGGEIRLTVVPPKGASAPKQACLKMSSDASKASAEIAVPSAKLWSPDEPALYNLRADLVADGAAVDSVAETFGMRKIEARDGKILLNNKPVFIAAALDQDFYPGTHYTIPSRSYVLKQFREAKKMGLNMLRCHIKVPDPVYLECADRAGLLVWYEIPNWINLNDKSKRRAKETLTAMFERDHNHPSFVVASIINEGWGIDLLDSPENRVWLGEMYDYAKSLQPNRLIVDNSPCGRNFHVKSDIDDFHIYFQIPDLASKYADWIRNLAGRPAFTFNRGPEGVRRGDEPIMLSEFGNWGLPRLGPLTDCEGGKPWWFSTGRRANTFPVGVEERFLNHRLDTVFGSFDGLADEFQMQEWRALKFQIEEMRKYASIAGYVVTEFTDLHWEPNGLLDFRRNPKLFSPLMPAVQNQDIVFVRMDKHNYTSGENAALDIWVSHFSDTDLSNATVQWDIPGTGLEGEAAAKIGKAPFAEPVWSAKLPLPEVEVPWQALVLVELLDKSGRLIAYNSHDFVLFPSAAPEMPEKVIVRGRLDRSVVKEISDGASAVVCLERPEDLAARGTAIKVVDRVEDGCWCNCLTWFKPGPAFAGAPVPTTMDMSFGNIIPSSAIRGISLDYWADDVLGGIFVGWVDSNVAVMAQARCGKGKAIITTLPLTKAADSDPMAKWILASLAAYVRSRKCSPELTL